MVREKKTTMYEQEKKMKSARVPEPNKTKEITFYGYSMKAPFERDTPAASETKKSFGELGPDVQTLCECTYRKKRNR